MSDLSLRKLDELLEYTKDRDDRFPSWDNRTVNDLASECKELREKLDGMTGERAINFGYDCARWPGLAKLVEECGELMSAAGKLMIGRGQSDPFGNRAASGRQTTAQDLEDEIADVYAALNFVVGYCKLNKDKIDKRIIAKIQKYEEWRQNNPIQMDP